jgi:D-alanine--poly(phosphoribitol) ligase subunit 2
MDIIKVLYEIRPEVDFSESEMFIEEGLLDSFDILALVSAIEEYYNIEIDLKELVPDNFESVQSIQELIYRVTRTI